MTPRTAFLLAALLAGCAAEPEQAATSSAGTGGGAVVPGSQEDLVANVGDRVFFDLDKSSLTSQGGRARDNMAVLSRQADWLARYPRNAVQIAGNCDERGTTEYNLALGQRRANVTKNYLVGKGLAENRVTTISYGKERPTALGSDEEAWAQNRNAITSVR